MTLKKIATEVGVSVSTVSRVVNQNNPKAATVEVQNKIWEVVRRTGYIPNSAARSLKMGTMAKRTKPRYIACIFGSTHQLDDNLFFIQLARYIEREAFRNNYILKYVMDGEELLNLSADELQKYIQVEGVIILGKFTDQLSQLVGKNFSSVVYTGLNPIKENYDQVLCNGYNAAISALDYLYQLGHREFGYVGERKNEIRFAAFQDMMEKLKLKNSFVTPVLEKHSFDLGYRSALFYKHNQLKCTAILAANDQTAIGLIKGLESCDIRVPKDVSVIGIDNITRPEYSAPQLTTINIPLEALGKQSFHTLVDRIDRTHTIPLEIYLPFHMIEGESCNKR